MTSKPSASCASVMHSGGLVWIELFAIIVYTPFSRRNVPIAFISSDVPLNGVSGVNGSRERTRSRIPNSPRLRCAPTEGCFAASVGAHRNLGLFGILDLVRSRDPWTPITPFNGTSDEMKAVGAQLRKRGLYTMIANNSIHTNPPLCITEDELAQGFEIIDAALDIADQAVTD